ncbi:MAG TPA: DUF5908 family protein [Flavisolibacter sp.]|nr:DUF5908 family protein [Flavisolibacter sp.]
MAIEVRELIIRASIGKEENPAVSPAKEKGNEDPSQEIIRQCVEKVLEIIKEKNGR